MNRLLSTFRRLIHLAPFLIIFGTSISAGTLGTSISAGTLGTSISVGPQPDQTGKSSLTRTVIFVHYVSSLGENLFLRGGISADMRDNCTSTASTDGCALPIQTRLLGTIDTYDGYNYWRVGDTFLDWHGSEPSQGEYNGEPALGTPTAWTSNDPYSPAYQELNKYGDNYWMVDMNMDCTQTEGGWFEVKVFLNGWESDVLPISSCTGDVGGVPPYSSGNHMGLCGRVNVFTYGQGSCVINHF